MDSIDEVSRPPTVKKTPVQARAMPARDRGFDEDAEDASSSVPNNQEADWKAQNELQNNCMIADLDESKKWCATNLALPQAREK